jgi:hypothetical protein
MKWMKKEQRTRHLEQRKRRKMLMERRKKSKRLVFSTFEIKLKYDGRGRKKV